MKKAFFDTNLLIAHVFFINSLHLNAEKVFNDYDEFYWSYFVQNEFMHRYSVKQKNVRSFFNDLQKYFENPEQEFYSIFDLNEFVLDNYSGNLKKDAKSSINPFWREYFGIETQISFSHMKKVIDYCLKDLSITSNKTKRDLQQIMQLTPQRTKSYSNIDGMLKNQGVKDADRTVILDGHDFACYSNDSVDFVTFDIECYEGARNVELLCFGSIKGKYDFNAS